jgi:hypothetical protein
VNDSTNVRITVKVCRPCMRVVEETGGVKYQSTKKVVEAWSRYPYIRWELHSLPFSLSPSLPLAHYFQVGSKE